MTWSDRKAKHMDVLSDHIHGVSQKVINTAFEVAKTQLL